MESLNATVGYTGLSESILVRTVENLATWLICTVKPVLSGHSEIDKTKVLKTHYHLMHVKSIAECSKGEHPEILLTCIKQLSVLKTNFDLLSGRSRQILLYIQGIIFI